MDASPGPEVVVDAADRRDEPVPLSRGQSGKDLPVEPVRRCLGLLEDSSTRGREVERVGAPVVRVAPALHQAMPLETVDEGDHDAAADAGEIGDALLRDAVRGGDAMQHRVGLRDEPERSEELTEARLGPSAHRREAEHHVVGIALRRDVPDPIGVRTVQD